MFFFFCRYINLYGMKFSKEDHILFIKLFYELVTLPDIEPLLLVKFCNVLVLLLKYDIISGLLFIVLHLQLIL